MDFDFITITVGGIVILLSIIASLTSRALRTPKRDETCSDEDCARGMSVVIACHDNAYQLERNLPALLEQEYPNFEVIVVNESSTDETDDVLKQLKNKYPNLYTTFIPESSHYLSRRKLALTIGVKAAKNEWIVFVDVMSKPANEHWLKRIAQRCSNDKDLVLGYANYSDETRAYYRFRQLIVATRNMIKAQRSTAYASGGNVVAMRRSLFLNDNGFLKDLKYLRGEFDFLVNEYARPERTTVATDALMVKDEPTKRSWINDNLFYMETRRHLNRSKSWRFPFIIDTFLLHFAFIADIAVIIFSAIKENWILLGASIFAIVILFLLRTIFVVKTAKAMCERLPVALIPIMELRVVWTNIVLFFRYWASDKNDFIRK